MFVHSIGHFHPDNVIDNGFLASLDIGTDDEWIVSRTGIRTRHTALPLDYIRTTLNCDPREGAGALVYSMADMAARAAEMALARAGLEASDIGMVVAGGTSPRLGCPAEASVVADRLGLTVPCFDLNAACSTWAVQLHVLSGMKPEALPDFLLVVNPEILTLTVDYRDRRNAVLMGDCFTATVVSPRVPGTTSVCRTTMDSDPSGWRKVVIPSAGHMCQDGGAVQNFAIRKTMATLEELRPHARNGFYFAGHQANLMMLQSACARAGVAESQHLYNVDRAGNCGAAGAPSVLSEHWDDFRTGDEVIAAVVGAGLTWAGVLMRFQ